MKTFLILFVALFPACVFAQTGNLPTIKNPQNADRLETKTRWFPAAFRLDTLKSYFIAEANDSLAVHRVDIDANAGAINALEGQNDGVVTSGLVTGSASKILSLTRSAPLSVLEVDFTDLVNDADSDPTNEIQTLQEVTDEEATTTADITANSFTGDGSALTGVDAEKLDNEDPGFYLDSKWTQTGASWSDYVNIINGKVVRALTNNSSNTAEVASFEVVNTYANSQPGGRLVFQHDNSAALMKFKIMLRKSRDVLTRFMIDSDGNVGIGTESPTSLLHVAGRIKANSLEIPIISVGTSVYETAINLDGDITFRESSTTENASLGGFQWRNYAAGPRVAAKIEALLGSASTRTNLAFYTASNYNELTERLRIDETGKVGIGTNDPDTELEVDGTVKATEFIGYGSGLTDVNAFKLDGQEGRYYEKLTESQVDDFADNNGYLKSEVDGTIGNELPWGNLSSAAANDYSGDLDALVFGTVICDGCTNAPTGAVDGWVTTLPVADGSSSKMQTYNEIGADPDGRGIPNIGKSWTRASVGSDFSGWYQNYNEQYPQPTTHVDMTTSPSFGTIAAHTIKEVSITSLGVRTYNLAVLNPGMGVTAGIIYTVRCKYQEVIISAANITSSSVTHNSTSNGAPWRIRILK